MRGGEWEGLEEVGLVWWRRWSWCVVAEVELVCSGRGGAGV